MGPFGLCGLFPPNDRHSPPARSNHLAFAKSANGGITAARWNRSKGSDSSTAPIIIHSQRAFTQAPHLKTRRGQRDLSMGVPQRLALRTGGNADGLCDRNADRLRTGACMGRWRCCRRRGLPPTEHAIPAMAATNAHYAQKRQSCKTQSLITLHDRTLLPSS